MSDEQQQPTSDDPERIYLQDPEGPNSLMHEGRTWCEDRQNPGDTAYIRADVAIPTASLGEPGRSLTLQSHHGWRPSAPEDVVIRTPCPTCGGQLFIGSGGHLTCAVLACPSPNVGVAIDILKRCDSIAQTVSKLEEAQGILVAAGKLEGPATDLLAAMTRLHPGALRAVDKEVRALRAVLEVAR